LSLESEIPFETSEGYQYIVSFTEIQSIPKEYNIPLVSISIVLVSQNIETNSLKTLNKFIQIILAYLEQNDVIVYFYCDTAPIKIRKNRIEKISNQEFRFNLFLSMFNKLKSDHFYLQPIKLTDSEKGNHFTALISKISNLEKVEMVKTDLETFNK